MLRNPAVVNFLDGCAISLPCHQTGAPPAGLMLAAPALGDQKLLLIAHAAEQLLRER
jgi:aspartyl-tRNA(Asn)/glutamyl-tRNA(Gln) amidotransferase subunit A